MDYLLQLAYIIVIVLRTRQLKNEWKLPPEIKQQTNTKLSVWLVLKSISQRASLTCLTLFGQVKSTLPLVGHISLYKFSSSL